MDRTDTVLWDFSCAPNEESSCAEICRYFWDIYGDVRRSEIGPKNMHSPAHGSDCAGKINSKLQTRCAEEKINC